MPIDKTELESGEPDRGGSPRLSKWAKRVWIGLILALVFAGIVWVCGFLAHIYYEIFVAGWEEVK